MKLAIIPARGGSKRIPRKNIKDFLGKPIIAYSIEAAIKSNLFDEIMVSTDDHEIAEIAEKYGAVVPFLRSEKNANDYATTIDVIEEVINNYKNHGTNFEYTCCIYPTAPLLTADKLIDSFRLLINNDYKSVYPICGFSYPVQRGLTYSNSKIEMLYPENINKRSQDLEKIYHDAGQFYFLETDYFSSNKKILSDKTGAIILNELETQDIDNETDWKLAELKYKLLYANL